jgi:glc operon protein GlcG
MLAIEKARTAARLQTPAADIEDNINRGRPAGIAAACGFTQGSDDSFE